ncbi:MAG: sulfatase-like hydrolase/transferase [Rubripirellula sp.]|nr:sulfatase-like hydrolase/transferase [Rubripirellula sp.]
MLKSPSSVFTAILSIVLGPTASSTDAEETRQSNVVVFLVDDLGPDEIVCYASNFHETPNIDALAARGMRFTHAYSGSTLCSPSRAALLTGRSPARLRLTDWIPGQPQINRKTVTPDWQTWISRERVLLPEAMKENQYATCFLGKWHLVPRPKPTERNNATRVAELAAMYQDHMPENNGFDENFGGDHSPNQGKRFLYPAFQTLPRLSDKGGEKDCLTDVLTDCAIDFLERKQNQPFFLYLSYYTVHTPITGKPSYVNKYEQKLIDNPGANFYMDHPGKAAMIQSLDESIGRVVAKLKEINQLDNTLIIFTGDNGSQGNEFVVNHRGNKGTAYEGGTRVPLIVAGPRVRTGVSDVPTIAMDLYPTILSYIDARPKPEEHLDGVSIMPLLTGTDSIPDRPLFWHYPHYDETTPYSSAIIDGWKLIRYADDGKTELYHLKNDPLERTNLAAAKPKQASWMAKQMDEYLADVDAQPAAPNPNYDPDSFSGGIRDFRIWDQGKKQPAGGFHTHQISSPYQAGKTHLRILLPDNFDLRQNYRVLYVLPVHEDGVGIEKHGDGLVEIKKHDFHNRHQLICVAPGYTSKPWYADHDLNPKKQDESHLLKTVLPFIEKRYPVRTDVKSRLLLGFSKSGWGAATLLLRHPDIFYRAAAWDSGIRVDTGPIEESDRDNRIAREWGSRANFEAHRLSNLIRLRGQALGDESRLFYFNTEGTRAIGGVEIHRLLVEHGIPHRYVMEPHRKHAWNSGWIPEAMTFLVDKMQSNGEASRD